MSRKIVSVVGATGVQGRSVVNALVKDNKYSVRAVTRNPNSEKAKALASRGVEVVKADANDLESLIAAFRGSSIIYSMTDFFEPFAKSGPAKAVEVEVAQGINIAKAASATETLEHFIWSTLPNGRKISNGKFIIPHFEAKNTIDQHIKSDATLLAKTTFLWVTFFAANYGWPMFTPYEIPTAGKYIQIQDTPPDVPLITIGDAEANIGLFVKAIIAEPEKTLPGKFVLAHVEETTVGDMLQTWAKAQGKTAQYVQVDEKTFHAIWPMWAEETGIMMQFWDWAREKSWSGEEGILTKNDLNVEGRLVGLEEALASLVL
jgi:hypothetical protein